MNGSIESQEFVNFRRDQYAACAHEARMSGQCEEMPEPWTPDPVVIRSGLCLSCHKTKPINPMVHVCEECFDLAKEDLKP